MRLRHRQPETNPCDDSTQIHPHIDDIEDTLSYLPLHGRYDIVCAKVFDLLYAADKRWSTHRAHLLRLQTSQGEPMIRPVSQQVYHLRATHVHRVCRCIKLTSLSGGSEDFGIPNFGQLFRAQSEEDLGYEVSGLMPRYDPNILLDSILIKLQTGLLYYCQPFHCPTSVEHLGLDCKVEYINVNQGIMPQAHNIWVTVYAKWIEWPRSHLSRMNFVITSIIHHLDSTESDPPILGGFGWWESIIDIF
jgi:hypothetical protein